ncbi:hypothetical protein KIN20_001711 [Parelaphostrongylus tenuis]|uniref:Uncharacterized protein n=1 Tax=Parelaphostrongylus tenuis TaxID=148309 RepID=A0AAD5QGB5_PARTN|nr:hypothetical protein KIN20_001711 [Parelaphostrongylus tenuis]
MPPDDEDWQIMLNLAVRGDEDTGDESGAIMEGNLSTPDSGAEDGDLIDGSDDAQQVYLKTAPVMGEWTTDVRTPTLLPFDESSIGIEGGVVLDCREPVGFYELFRQGFGS